MIFCELGRCRCSSLERIRIYFGVSAFLYTFQLLYNKARFHFTTNSVPFLVRIPFEARVIVFDFNFISILIKTPFVWNIWYWIWKMVSFFPRVALVDQVRYSTIARFIVNTLSPSVCNNWNRALLELCVICFSIFAVSFYIVLGVGFFSSVCLEYLRLLWETSQNEAVFGSLNEFRNLKQFHYESVENHGNHRCKAY